MLSPFLLGPMTAATEHLVFASDKLGLPSLVTVRIATSALIPVRT